MMKTIPTPSRRACLGAIAAALFGSVAAAQASGDGINEPVAALFQHHCLECHAVSIREGGLSLSTLEDILIGGKSGKPAITPGHPERSKLIRHVRGEAEPRMPKDADRLGDDEVRLLEQWVRTLKIPEGQASSKGWWAYRPLATSPPPRAGHETEALHPIDRFVTAKLEQQGLDPAPPATRHELVRRAYFDLLGLPPTYEQTQAFVADARPDAWQRLIDELLNSPRYGERWARHWLDLVRYADSSGNEGDREYPGAWRYRDYIVRALNSDRPYDRFVGEHLAGDELWPNDAQAKLATGFMALAPRFSSTVAQESRQATLNEITSTVTQTFMAQTFACAQCHDHKYDPIPQSDYYRLQAFFIPMEVTGARIPFVDSATEAMAAEAIAAATAERDIKKRQLAELRERMIDRLLEKIKDLDDNRDTARKVIDSWLDDENNLEGKEKAEAFFTADQLSRYAELSGDVERGGDDNKHLGRLDRVIRRHGTRATVARNAQESSSRPVFNFAFVRIRGEYDRLGERVFPGFPRAVEGHDKPVPFKRGRLQNLLKARALLADWLVNPESKGSALAARVMVNRLWQHHFGRGIVATPSDFGRQGARPTHPELLDWLAQKFIDSGWSIKAIHRQIMTSATYRQSSRVESTLARDTDPANRLLWRFNRRRLEGEAIRDSVLKVAGILNTKIGGPGVFPPLPQGVEKPIEGMDLWEDTDGYESRRRSIYIFQRRQLELPLMAVLDAGVLTAPLAVRAVSTTPLQSLAMLNGATIDHAVDALARQADRTTDRSPGQPDAATIAWRLALARDPDAEEHAVAANLLHSDPRYGLRHLCRVLLNTNEFVYID